MNDPADGDEEIVKALGRGQFGSVYLIKSKGEMIARKIILLEHSAIGEKLKTIQKEVDILKTLNFRYLIHYYSDKHMPDRREYRIDMEYCEGSDLTKLLDKTKSYRTYLNNNTAIRLFVNLALGVQYLHHHKIVHRDLKPDNIFLSAAAECVIGDVGVSKVISNNIVLQTPAGTPLYMAPEVFHNEGYTELYDVWSIGLVFYQICSTSPANEWCRSYADLTNFYVDIKLPDLPPHFDKRIMNLIKKMVVLREDRISIDKVLEDPLLVEYQRQDKISSNFLSLCYSQHPHAQLSMTQSVFQPVTDRAPDSTFFILSYTLGPSVRFLSLDTNHYSYIAFYSGDMSCPTLFLSYEQILVNLIDYQWVKVNLPHSYLIIPVRAISRQEFAQSFQDKILRKYCIYQIYNIYVAFLRYFGYTIYMNFHNEFVVTPSKNFRSRYQQFKDDTNAYRTLKLIFESLSDLSLLSLQDALFTRIIFDIKNKVIDNREFIRYMATYYLQIIQNPPLKEYATSFLIE